MKLTIWYVILISLSVGAPHLSHGQQRISATPTSRDLLAKDFLTAMGDPGGSPFVPVETIMIEDVTWVNNLTHLTGRIIKVTKDTNGKSIYDILTYIAFDSIKSKNNYSNLPTNRHEIFFKGTWRRLEYFWYFRKYGRQNCI